AESLQAKLSGREEQALAVRPTNNAEAYDAYLRGLACEPRASVAGLTHPLRAGPRRNATDSYQRGLSLDPNFAVRWARLSRLRASTRFTTLAASTPLPFLGPMQRKKRWITRRGWSRTCPKPCLP